MYAMCVHSPFGQALAELLFLPESIASFSLNRYNYTHNIALISLSSFHFRQYCRQWCATSDRATSDRFINTYHLSLLLDREDIAGANAPSTSLASFQRSELEAQPSWALNTHHDVAIPRPRLCWCRCDTKS